ncbi:MAG: HD domain-containing phosphohydrolase [Syntrophales bacterium]
MMKPLSILLVEDSEDDALLMIRELIIGGYEPEYERVEMAKAMRAALRQKHWDVILCDYQMPQFNGLAAIALLKETNIDIPLIIVSGTIGEETAVECMRLGARDYIMKGNLSRLAPAIERELKEAESRRQQEQAEEALRESEEKFRTIFDKASDGILIADAITKKILQGNATICSMLGYTKKEIEGLTINDIHPPNDLPHVLAEFEKQRKGEITLAEDLTVLRKDGSTFYADINSSLVSIWGVHCLVGTFRDITDRKQADEALRKSEKAARRLAHENDLVAEIGRIISSTLNIEEVYERFAEKVREAISFDRIAVNAIDMTNHTRVIKYVKGVTFSDQKMGEIYPLAGTGIERAVLTKSSLLINRKNREDLIRDYPGILSLLLGSQSSLIIPLISQNEVIGSLAMHSVKIDAYSENDLHFAERVGAQIAGAIANAQLFLESKQTEEHLQHVLDSLKRAVNTTIQVMVSAVEVRDPYTAGHQVRSANLAHAIATEMGGLASEKIEGLRMAGSIHDIGKLSIPAEILSKPTKLSDIEFSLIKEHALKGYEMLKDVESPWPLAEIVYQHHERMDGSGYPRNLQGEEILLEARILTVADVVEAMASHRPYRPALGIDAALEEIEKNSGTLYDRTVAAACLRLFREKGYKLEEA